MRRQFRLSESKTANIPRTAPIGEVMTLTLGAVWIVDPSVAFPWWIPWSAKPIPREQTSTYLSKTQLLLAKECQARNIGLNS